MKIDAPEIRTLMTATDAATALGISRQSLNKQMQAGRFKSVMRLGPRLYVLRRDEIDAVLSGRHKQYSVPKKNEALL